MPRRTGESSCPPGEEISCHLVESADECGEIIRPLSLDRTDSIEDRLGQAAHEASRALVTEGQYDWACEQRAARARLGRRKSASSCNARVRDAPPSATLRKLGRRGQHAVRLQRSRHPEFPRPPLPEGVRLSGMNEARLLRIAIVAACLIPITAGGAGVLLGPAMVGIDTASIAAESHYRYLSGLLLSIGVLFLTTVPRIERSTVRFRLLAIIVIVGGLCRLLGSLLNRNVDASSLFALGMELGVTPALLLWQARVATRHR